jgi:hypothetical protein
MGPRARRGAHLDCQLQPLQPRARAANFSIPTGTLMCARWGRSRPMERICHERLALRIARQAGTVHEAALAAGRKLCSGALRPAPDHQIIQLAAGGELILCRRATTLPYFSRASRDTGGRNDATPLLFSAGAPSPWWSPDASRRRRRQPPAAPRAQMGIHHRPL